MPWLHAPGVPDSLSVTGAPPRVSTVRSRPHGPDDRVVKAICRPSGDQTGNIAPSVPGIGSAAPESIRRIHRRYSAVSLPVAKAMLRPSGEMLRSAGVSANEYPCGGSMSKRTTCGAGVDRGRPHSVNAPTIVAAMRAVISGTAHGARGRVIVPASPVKARRSRIASSSRRTSAAACQRFFGFFSRQRRSRSTMRGLRRPGSFVRSGSVLRTDASTSDDVSPSNARRPVSSS